MKRILPLLAIVVATPAAAQDGGTVFKRACAMCHTNAAGAPNRLGPNLAGISGRKAGTVAGFRYSPAMTKAGITWNAKTLDAFLAKPSAVVPGNRMGFGGVPAAADRAALVGYLVGGK